MCSGCLEILLEGFLASVRPPPPLPAAAAGRRAGRRGRPAAAAGAISCRTCRWPALANFLNSNTGIFGAVGQHRARQSVASAGARLAAGRRRFLGLASLGGCSWFVSLACSRRAEKLLERTGRTWTERLRLGAPSEAKGVARGALVARASCWLPRNGRETMTRRRRGA